MSGTSQLSTCYYVGKSGKGTFNQTGGTNSTPAGTGYTSYLGYNTGQQRHVQLERHGPLGRLYPDSRLLRRGRRSTQSGGANAVSTALNLGYYAGSSGAYSLSGTGQLSAAQRVRRLQLGRHRPHFSRPAARIRPLPLDRRRRPVPTQRRHASGQRQPRQPGVFDGGNSPATLERQRHRRSHQRHLEEPRRPVGQHGRQLALDRARPDSIRRPGSPATLRWA